MSDHHSDPPLAHFIEVQDKQVELNGTFLVHPDRITSNSDLFPLFLDTRRYQSQEAGTIGSSRSCMEIVIDGSNLLPFHFLRTGDRMGRAVVKIQRSDGATGTGFLVAPDVLLTNHHVLPTVEIAASAVAMANYEVSPPFDPSGRPTVSVLDPTALFLTNADLDFTFCGVPGLAYLGSIPLDRERMHVASDETVTIIQHPRGRPKEIALRDNRVIRTDDVVVQYSCDTEPGSSGSPVFNNQWKPVAIHHASVMTDSPEGRKIAGNSRARYLNEGIRLSAIALWLETAEAESPQGREDVVRLRALFGGLNQRVGFFGALGRHGHGRPASEVVAETSYHRPDLLDIGYWDTRTIGDHHGGIREVLPDLCRVVSDMGLDVWCLSSLDAHGVETLCQQLWAVYGLNYQPVAASSSLTGAGPRILVRPSNIVSAEVYNLPGGGHESAACRLRIRKRNNSEAGFQLVAFSKPQGEFEDTNEFVRQFVADVDDISTESCVIIVGEPEMFEMFRRFLTTRKPNPTFTACDVRDGSLVVLDSAHQHFFHAYLSANLKPVTDLSRQITVVHDRQLPTDLGVWNGPMPFAVRLSLDSGGPESKPVASHLPSSFASLASVTPSPMANFLETQLRDLLIPLITKIVTEAISSRDH